MTVSRALDPQESLAGVEAPVKGSAATGTRPVGIGQPMAPLFTAMAVMMLVVLSLTFARSAGMVAALLPPSIRKVSGLRVEVGRKLL